MDTDNERMSNVANMTAAVRDVFGSDTPIEAIPNGVLFHSGMSRGEPNFDVRPVDERLQRLLKNKKEADEFLKKGYTDKWSLSLKCNLLKCRADAHMKEEEYQKTVGLYLLGAEIQCRTTLPPRNSRTMVYMDLDKVWESADVVACFIGAAEALMKLGDYAQALFWLGESTNLLRNIRDDMKQDDPSFEWFDFHLGTSQFYHQKSTLYSTLADCYLKLGNTGACVFYRLQAQVNLSDIPSRFSNSELKRLSSIASEALRDISTYRHPEPTLVASLEVVDEKSHIHGSWKKIELKHSGAVTSRMGSGVFVYDGHLYIVGGEKFHGGPYYSELWRINLSKPQKWEPLPTCPISERKLQHQTLTGFRIAVGPDDKAYYFTGSPDLLYFDLKASKWSSLKTTFESDDVIKQSWPYPDKKLQDFTMNCVGNKLYVFGGRHGHLALGCDLFLELDIPTAVWRRLSGEPEALTPSFLSPGPRINACSWITKDKKDFWLMYGDANRMGAKLGGEPHGAMSSHEYDDIWTWNFASRKWKREKLVGNGPSPRTEMASVYNPVLDKVVTFGGYSPTAPTSFMEQDAVFQYTYYADTFICDHRIPKPASLDSQASASVFSSKSPSPLAHRHTIDASPSSWRQVLTRGFPTYRAQAHLVADPMTGKTYLFSGYVNTDYVPTRVQNTSRSFADLWELRLDVPGGGFESVDLEEEARTAKAGPWQRCFSCGSAGPWKKCGGSCRGRVFFCSSQCLKDGWKEHKQTHHCRKVG
ncbi:hypothetical protein GALMADRAFT_251865 [Galerina marginata CBS 339.88]|uniref:Uncharacterized protein n=1 Tax=Galerina marginata (strain CBS 339.88) TaxID=685588 RepID=A0A067ST80_GALM3|nr:hypothetical protein GALMADRAFT_251865 [Galerina marginata CBS 339.88]